MGALRFTFVFFLCLNTMFLLQAAEFSSPIVLSLEPNSTVQYIVKGFSLFLNCTVNSSNNMTLVWMWNTTRGRNRMKFSHSSQSSQLSIDRMEYKDSGIYKCVAKNKTHNTAAEISVDIKVGDLPPRPSSLNLYDVCDYPAKQAFISYVIPSSSSPSNIQYPYDEQLILKRNEGNHDCAADPLTPIMAVYPKYDIHPSSNSTEVHTNVSTAIKSNYQSYTCRNPRLECSILCAKVVVSNAFGSRYIENYWELRTKGGCGIVSQLTVQTTKNTANLSWSTPRCLADTTLRRLVFQIKCEPKCGIKNLRKRLTSYPQSWKEKIEFLEPYKRYKFSIYCGLRRVTSEAKPASIEAWTKEGEPSNFPKITTIYWLYQLSSATRGSAFVQWEPLTDEKVLNGKLDKYLLTYKFKDFDVKPQEMAVGPDKQSVKIPNLKMGNYTFTIKACTRAGCGNETQQTFLPAYVPVPPENVTEKPVEETSTNISLFKKILLVFGVLIIMGSVSFLIWCVCRRKTEPPLELNNIEVSPESDRDNESQASSEPHVYASANCALSNSKSEIDYEKDLSRSSSSSTCSSTV